MPHLIAQLLSYQRCGHVIEPLEPSGVLASGTYNSESSDQRFCIVQNRFIRTLAEWLEGDFDGSSSGLERLCENEPF